MFHDALDLRDTLIQGLVTFSCYPECLKALEGLSLERCVEVEVQYGFPKSRVAQQAIVWQKFQPQLSFRPGWLAFSPV